MTASAESPPAEQPHEGRVARNAVTYMAAQLISWSVAFLSVSVIPRQLGEKAVGELALATTLVGTVYNTLQFSIDPYLTTEIGRDRSRTAELLGGAMGLRLMLVIPLILISMLTLHASHVTPAVWFLSYLTLIGCCTGLLTEAQRASLAGWEDARRVSIIDLLSALSALVAIPFLRYGPQSVAITGAIAAVICVFLSFSWINHYVRVRPIFNLKLWKKVTLGGLPFFVNTFVIQFYQVASVLILKRTGGEGSVGVFSQVMRLQGTFLFIPTAIGLALLPSLARMSDADPVTFRRTQTRVLALLIALCLPVTAGILVLAEPFCHLLYGHKAFTDMPLALRISALNLMPLYITTVMYRFLVAQRKNMIWSVFLVGTVLLNAVCCWFYVPLTLHLYHNACAGAVLASLTAEAATVVFAFVLLGTNPLTGQTLGRILRGALSALAMAGVMWISRQIFIVVPAVLGLATYIAMAWMLHVLEPEEQERLGALLNSKLRRSRAH